MTRIYRWRRKSVFRCFVFFVLLILAGCSGKTPSDSNEQPTAIPPLSTKITPSKMVSPTGTQGSTEVLTLRSSPTETMKLTLLPTMTQTPQATLEPTQFVEALQKFLSEGDNCHPPCMLGITPGQTTYAQASNFFRWLRHPLSRDTYPDGKEYYSTLIGYNDESISIEIRLSLEDDIVKNIYAGIMLSKYSRKVTDRQAWKAYSPDTLLSQYGSPSQIEFKLSFPTEEGFPSNTAWYNMVLKYENIGLRVEYFHGLSVDGNFIKACPITDQYSNILINLGKDLENSPHLGVPLEKATSLTLTQFSELLTQNSKQVCFQLSKDSFFSK